jgi:hypothetical protein
MAFKTDDEVIKFIKDNSTVKPWVVEARKNHKKLNALVTGKDFHDVLITQIEKIESADRQIARKKYSKNIIDLFERVMNPRSSIFNAFGGSVRNDMNGELMSRFISVLSHFKGQKSIKKYLSENFFRLLDTDPNGLIFIEYVSDQSIFPTYKSINDIRTYISDGQLLDVLLFEPKTILSQEKGSYQEWRVVDSEKDYRVKQVGQNYTVIEDLTFSHPFGVVPACILSDLNEVGTELRVSPLFHIVPLAEDYARDKSIRTIYKFQHGFPRHWRYEQTCRSCKGTGKTGEGKCAPCDGKGHLRTNDVTDVSIIEIPRDNESAIITPNVEGFIAPDLATWARMNEDLIEDEAKVTSTMWGTDRVKKGTNETATGRFIDTQPIMVKLDTFADNVEWVHNQLAHFVESWFNGSPKKSNEYHITYGRRFIIESADTILERYSKSRKEGDNSTILDKILNEYILSKYQNNPIMVDEMTKKVQIEPYVHQSIDQVSAIFGATEAIKKVNFVHFWDQADKNKDVKQLTTEFIAYNALNTIVIVTPNTNNNEQ